MSLPIGTVSPSLAATPAAIAATAMAVRALSLKARQDNSGPVYIGDAGVTATNGYCLLPGDEVTLQFGNAMTCGAFTCQPPILETAWTTPGSQRLGGFRLSDRIPKDVPGTIPV